MEEVWVPASTPWPAAGLELRELKPEGQEAAGSGAGARRRELDACLAAGGAGRAKGGALLGRSLPSL